MPSDIELRVEQMREERRKMRRTAVIIVLAVFLVGAVLLVWQGPITGYAALDTLDNFTQIAGSTPDNELSFEKIPNFRARVGETVRFKVKPNTEEVEFTDDTGLFDITDKGVVEFTPDEEDIGHHRALIFIKKDLSKFYFQDIHIIIEDN